MKLIRKITIGLCLVCCIFMFCACTGNNNERSFQEELVGEWYSAEEAESIIFYEDGTVHIEEDSGSDTDGYYEVIHDGNAISLETEEAAIIVDFVLAEDTLRLSYDDETILYERIKDISEETEKQQSGTQKNHVFGNKEVVYLLSSVSCVGEEQQIKFEYEYKYSYNRDGFPTEITVNDDGEETEEIIYQYNGSVLQAVSMEEIGTYGEADVFEYEYDVDGNLVSISSNYGCKWMFDKNKIVGVADAADNTWIERCYYDKNGNRVEYEMTGCLSNYYTYDQYGYVTYVEVNNSENNYEFEYDNVYDINGNIMTICKNDLTKGTVSSVEFTYDEDARIEKIESDYGWSVKYEYDQNGNIIKITETDSDNGYSIWELTYEEKNLSRTQADALENFSDYLNEFLSNDYETYDYPVKQKLYEEFPIICDFVVGSGFGYL